VDGRQASLTGRVGLVIRAATAADAPRVASCVHDAYRHYVDRIGRPPGPMLDDYAGTIRRHQVCLAELEGAVVGVLVLKTTDEGFLLDNVAVDPRHHGTGVGRALLTLAEREAWRAGHRSIYLYTHERMTENQALYTRI